MRTYKRLTKRFINSQMQQDVQLNETVSNGIFRLAELEDMIEQGLLIKLPCVREINSALGKYEAVYLQEGFATIQECIVNSIERGWEIIAYYGNAHCKAEAEAKLEELKRGQQ